MFALKQLLFIVSLEPSCWNHRQCGWKEIPTNLMSMFPCLWLLCSVWSPENRLVMKRARKWVQSPPPLWSVRLSLIHTPLHSPAPTRTASHSACLQTRSWVTLSTVVCYSKKTNKQTKPAHHQPTFHPNVWQVRLQFCQHAAYFLECNWLGGINRTGLFYIPTPCYMCFFTVVRYPAS